MKMFLIGYRASGKTTIGGLLARQLNIPFVDTDLLTEELIGMSIKESVATHGWKYFRAREKEAVKALLQQNDCVVATGGGVVLAQENVDLLKKMGPIIWLNAPLQDMIERLREDANGETARPQLTNDNIVQETIAVLKQRIPLYEKAADLIIDTNGKSALQSADEIYQKMLETGVVAKINKSSISKVVN